ncbi:MAG: hypothetical protein NW220_16765 [Leptolyngbyaceae cyanobacterium bins.349]|nr:hypothetical protein [Leptolyngbyaceae cyanobacterium bins.349]
MTLLTSIIDLDCIQVNVNKMNFDRESKANEIQALAYSISDLKGLVRIPIVKSLGIDEYELVDGYLEYYAYEEARKLNPDLPDRITVFVMKPSNEQAITKQIDVNRQVSQINNHATEVSSDSSALALRVSILESKLGEGFHKITSELQTFKAESQFLKKEILETIDSKLPRLLPPLEAFNEILDEAIRKQVFNKLEKLKGKKKAQEIVNSLQAHRINGKEFQSFSDVRNSLDKGMLSPEMMLKLIDTWHD